AALHDDAHALGERLRHVLRRLTPDGAGEEQRLAVPPLVGLPVERTRRGRDAEPRDGRTGRGEAQLGVVDQVADDRDDGLACHGEPLGGGNCGVLRMLLWSTSPAVRPMLSMMAYGSDSATRVA